jgi:hypothetical protein
MKVDENNFEKYITKGEKFFYIVQVRKIYKRKLIYQDGTTTPELILFLIAGGTETNTHFFHVVNC